MTMINQNLIKLVSAILESGRVFKRTILWIYQHPFCSAMDQKQLNKIERRQNWTLLKSQVHWKVECMINNLRKVILSCISQFGNVTILQFEINKKISGSCSSAFQKCTIHNLRNVIFVCNSPFEIHLKMLPTMWICKLAAFAGTLLKKHCQSRFLKAFLHFVCVYKSFLYREYDICVLQKSNHKVFEK